MNTMTELFQCPKCKRVFSNFKICEKHLLRGCNAELKNNRRSRANERHNESLSRAHRSCKKGIWG